MVEKGEKKSHSFKVCFKDLHWNITMQLLLLIMGGRQLTSKTWF